MSIGKRALVLGRTQRGNRTLGSLALAVGALGLGLIALDLFGRWLPAPAPTDGLLALLGAGLLFASAVLHAPRPAHPQETVAGQEASRVSGDWLRWLSASTLLLVAGVAG